MLSHLLQLVQDPTIDIRQAVKDSIAQADTAARDKLPASDELPVAQLEADAVAKGKQPASEQTASRGSHPQNASGSSSREHIIRYTYRM